VPLPDDVAGALPAAGLLVGDGGDDQRAVERHARARQGHAGHHLRGHARLVVAGPATVDPATVDLAAERRMGPGRLLADRHHVDVGVEGQPRATVAVSPSQRGDEVGQFCRRPDDLRCEADLLELLLAQPDRLAHVAWRVDRGDPHQRLQEGDRLVLVDLAEHPLGLLPVDADVTVGLWLRPL
jgi:hypothetical protein